MKNTKEIGKMVFNMDTVSIISSKMVKLIKKACMMETGEMDRNTGKER